MTTRTISSVLSSNKGQSQNFFDIFGSDQNIGDGNGIWLEGSGSRHKSQTGRDILIDDSRSNKSVTLSLTYQEYDEFRQFAAGPYGGMKIPEMIVKLALERKDELASGSNALDHDLTARLYALERDIWRKRNSRRALVEIARHFLNEPSDELEEEIAQLCQMRGVSLEELMSEAEGKVIARSAEQDKSPSNAELFLRDLFKQPGLPIPANEIIELGQERGFTDKQLQTARKRLGIVTGKISGRGNFFFWYLPDDTHNEILHCSLDTQSGTTSFGEVAS